MKFLLTCEHASNVVPAPWKACFANDPEVLNTHRGFDPGARKLYRRLLPLADAGWEGACSRLVIELNRSLHHPALFSRYMGELSPADKESLIARYYRPFREATRSCIQTWIQQGHSVFHLSVHTFTPVLQGEVRNADIGLLYDPQRPQEKFSATRWRDIWKAGAPHWRIRMNYPYRGTADGHTTALRKEFTEGYQGLELEVNQGVLSHPGPARALAKTLQESLVLLLDRPVS